MIDCFEEGQRKADVPLGYIDTLKARKEKLERKKRNAIIEECATIVYLYSSSDRPLLDIVEEIRGLKR